MENAVTQTHDLQRDTIRKITDIVFSERKQGVSMFDADKVASIMAIICEHEILYDQIMEARS